MLFRPLRKQDEPELLTLFKQLTKKTIVLKVNSIISDKNCNCIVIEDNKKIIGFGAIILYQAPTKGYIATIEDVIINQNYRGEGLGRELLEKLISIAKKNNIKIINLTSNPTRIAARKLYTSLGFQLLNTGVFRLNLQ